MTKYERKAVLREAREKGVRLIAFHKLLKPWSIEPGVGDPPDKFRTVEIYLGYYAHPNGGWQRRVSILQPQHFENGDQPIGMIQFELNDMGWDKPTAFLTGMNLLNLITAEL